MFIYVKKAHLDAECGREHLYADLPPEGARGGYCEDGSTVWA